MGVLLAGAKWIGSSLASLFGDLFRWVIAIGAYRLGRRAVKQEIAEDAVEVKDDQLKIAARPAAHRSSILERMFRNKRQ